MEHEKMDEVTKRTAGAPRLDDIPGPGHSPTAHWDLSRHELYRSLPLVREANNASACQQGRTSAACCIANHAIT